MVKPLHERALFAGYGDAEHPLGGYAVLLGVYGATMGGLLAGLRRGGRELPERLGLGDAALLGLATHKLTRLIARDKVTAPLRAPFVRYEGTASASELSESARGEGLQRAVGDLINCPFCLAPWVAGGLLALHAVRPREARWVGALFALTAVSDFLQRAYEWLGESLHRTRAEAEHTQQSLEEEARLPAPRGNGAVDEERATPPSPS